MIYYTNTEAVPYFFEDSPELAIHMAAGIVVFSLSCFYLLFDRLNDKYFRLVIMLAVGGFGVSATVYGYVTVIFSIYPCWLVYKYWHQ
jgi:hypothetical protein